MQSPQHCGASVASRGLVAVRPTRLDAPMRARTWLPVLPVLGLVLVTAVVTPAAEAAAVRYAKPGGTGTACTAVVPCKLSVAVNDASIGDEVVLAPGTYTPDVQIVPSSDSVHIHGTPGQPRPVISVSSPVTVVDLSSSRRSPTWRSTRPARGAALSLFGYNNTATRVVARTTSGTGCYGGFGALVQDVLCVASAGGTAFDLNFAGAGVVSTMKVRNLTAIATGGGAAFDIFSSGSGSHMTMDVKNSILSGATDVRTAAVGGAQTTVTLTTSNYDSVDTAAGGTVTPAGSATNQTAAPLFADTTLYHEAAGSPTVDAGAAEPTPARPISTATRGSSARPSTSVPTSSCRRPTPPHRTRRSARSPGSTPTPARRSSPSPRRRPRPSSAHSTRSRRRPAPLRSRSG